MKPDRSMIGTRGKAQGVNMTIDDVIEKFNTTPFLFLGSGITRRYYNLPDWKGLLEHFAREVRDDDFAYSFYENRAAKETCTAGLFPKIAELIQADYDDRWFRDPNLRRIKGEALEKVKHGLSPFKAEIAAYIEGNSMVVEEYRREIHKLAKLSEKNIAGVITTNYDTFLETYFQGYTKYVGQKQLIFSAIQGIAEIFKIHGSVEEPDSLVINEQDYLDFDRNCAYLAAKLMTIFMEYPIVFMGYSIGDNNVQKIMRAIVDCLDAEQLKILEDRFVFVEYQKGKVGAEVSPFTIMIENKPLTMKRVAVEDFLIVYDALEGKRAKLPVRMLRRFKQELYNFTITSMPTANLRVASIEDKRIADEELVLAIGKYNDFGLKGLHGIEADEWYRNIITEDIDFAADDLLEYAFPKLIRQNSGRLPLNKYLSQAKGDYPECRDVAQKQDFDFIISATIKKNRQCLGDYSSVMQIWNNEKQSLEKATRLIAHLPEEMMDVEELGGLLKLLFAEDMNILQNPKPSIRTNIRRLISVYDYLRWGKQKNFPAQAFVDKHPAESPF